MTEKKIKKIVLAYSGGLDTSVMLKWIKEEYDCEVVCYCADVGQGEEMNGLEAKALETGASKLYIEDLREDFVRNYVWTAVKANALYEGVYLLGTSLARPVIAKRQIEIPLTATAAKPYSTDRNLMHVSYEGGILEDPWAEPPADIFQMTRSPENAKSEAEYLEISFEAGEPVKINGEALGPVEILENLNKIGGEHGIGRVDIVENRFVGMKSRGVYETPGVTILQAAHRALESITLDREVLRLRDSLGVRFAESIYYGFWFAPEFEIMRTMIDQTQETVSGDVRLKLYKGN